MGFRIFSFIQAFHIYLRLDGFVQWPIITIFWPTWIILTVVFFYLMGIALMIMLAFYYKCLGQDENLHSY